MSGPYYYKHYTDYKKCYDYPSLDDISQIIYLEPDPEIQIDPSIYRVECSVTLHFIDTITKIKIFNSIIINDLKNNSNYFLINNLDYSFEAKDIPGYSIINFSTQTADLTISNPNQVITFEYSQIPVSNEVPYISTYYIKPIVTPTEDVILNYYITDFYHKEYLNEDTSETFTVTININGYPRIIKTKVPAGDNYINLGKFNNLGEQKFSILCKDKLGGNSHELFNFFLVKSEPIIKEYIMTAQDLFKYNIDNTDTKDKVSTNRDGLQKLIDYKSIQGFNKFKLLPGIYRVDHLGTLYIPSNFTLDMNSATIKLDDFAGDRALIMDLCNTFDSHVINGTIDGDYFTHDYDNSKNNSESVNGISISGKSKYSSFENLVVKDITGCGSITGMINSVDEYLDYTYLPPKAIGDTFKIGDIDRITGIDISSTDRTTCDFIDISGYSDIEYLSISRYLGDQGKACGSFNLICHFYDINKIFIKSTDAYQYRRVEVPATSIFIRVTLFALTHPSLLSYPTDLSIQLFKIPTHCAFKNIKFNNCRCGGMSQGAMNDMLIENCEFSNCGQISSKSAYNAEYGLDMMQDVTFKGLNFHDNPNNDFFACAGHNFIVEGQVAGNISVLERTKSLVVTNCKNTSIDLQGGAISTILNHGVYRIYKNEFTFGTVENNLSKNIKCPGSLGGVVSASTLGGIVSNSIYNKCTIKVSTSNLGYIIKISMTNCYFIPEEGFESRYTLSFNGGHKHDNIHDNSFVNCTFKGSSLLNGGYSLDDDNRFYCGEFINCTFEDTKLYPSPLANEHDSIIFFGCTLGCSNPSFIYYYDKRVEPFNKYKKATFTDLIFNDCRIKSTYSRHYSFIYAYSNPKGFCSFTNCRITLEYRSHYDLYLYIFDHHKADINYNTLEITLEDTNINGEYYFRHVINSRWDC